jgi:predicted transcriptional regulator
MRNSKNGYYTKVSTLSYKFEISQERAWEIVGELLDEGWVESVHDERSGEMKLCETGKTYIIMDLDLKRKRQKSKEFSKSKKQPGK